MLKSRHVTQRHRERTVTVPGEALQHNRQTVESYESYAEHYNTLVGELPQPWIEAPLRQIAEIVGPGGAVLEIGSGPGRDADFLEHLGARVRRTDATQAFLDLQAKRGKAGELLNVITDDLGGPYDAVIALAVLIHVDRDVTDLVLSKIAAALKPAGAFYVLIRDGDGETSGDYHMTYWRHEEFTDRLARAGLQVEWHSKDVNSKGEAWLSYIARTPAQTD